MKAQKSGEKLVFKVGYSFLWRALFIWRVHQIDGLCLLMGMGMLKPTEDAGCWMGAHVYGNMVALGPYLLPYLQKPLLHFQKMESEDALLFEVWRKRFWDLTLTPEPKLFCDKVMSSCIVNIVFQDQSLLFRKVIILGTVKCQLGCWTAVSEMGALESTPKNHPWWLLWKSGALDK